jgi:hypothetical protein
MGVALGDADAVGDGDGVCENPILIKAIAINTTIGTDLFIISTWLRVGLNPSRSDEAPANWGHDEVE